MANTFTDATTAAAAAVGDRLVTVTVAKTYLGVSGSDDDALIASMVEAATDAMEAEAARHLVSTSRTEIVDGSGQRRLYLAEPPESVTTVHQHSDQAWADANLVDADDYDLDGCCLDYRSRIWTAGRHNTRVVYLAGYATVPDDLVIACQRQVSAYYAWWLVDKMGLGVLKSQTVEGWAQSFRARVDLEPDVAAICAKHRPGRL